jgi:type III secretion system YscQ/HrcQ family protein
MEAAPAGAWPAAGRRIRYSLELESPSARATQILTLAFESADGLADLREALAFSPRPKAADFGRLALPVSITVGGVRLPLSDAASLAAGDLLIAGDPPVIPGRARLEYPGLPAASLDIFPDRLVATTALSIKEASVAEKTVGASGPQPPYSGDPGDQLGGLAGDLELPLRFEVGRRLMTLIELERLSPGQVLPFESDPSQAVTVSCHGQAVARGLLVDLGDGRLGVQLTEVGLAPVLVPKGQSPGAASESAGEADNG